MTKKKVAAKSNNTITFKKSELISKLETFLEAQDACDGDWLNKVRVEFLGEKMTRVQALVQFETVLEVEMATFGTPSVDEVKAKITSEMSDNNLELDFDEYSPFKVLSIKPVS